MSVLFLVLAIVWASATLVALVRVRHPAALGFPIMMTGWLTGDYPVFHMAAQAVVTVVLVALGALGATSGIIALVITVVSWFGLGVAWRVSRQARPTAETALAAGLGDDYLDRVEPDRRASLRTEPDPGLVRHPLRQDRSGIEFIGNLSYGDAGKRNLLDVYRPEVVDGPAPVLLQVHGGAWITGHKRQQAQPLLHRLARQGVVCVSINYRLGPTHRFPDPIVDVKRAIGWVRDNIVEHGGDPSKIVLTGGSAGGHLTSLAALTPNAAEFQPGFEAADTTVAACVPFYGPADFLDRHGIRGRLASLEPMLKRMVMPGSSADHAELYHAVSPLGRVNADAPPFFVIQGTHDVLVWREETRRFVEALRAVSSHPVVYWEVPGAQHAFDTFNSWRSAAAVDAVERFVAWVAAEVTAPPDPDLRVR